MRLILCEKPSQGATLAGYLNLNTRKQGYYEGNGVTVTWAIGHLLSLEKPEYYTPDLKTNGWDLKYLPVLPQKFVFRLPDYNDPKEKGRYDQAMVIKSLLSKATEVIIATDPDREGATIAWELLEFFGYSGATKRMFYSSLDNKSLDKAYKNLLDSKKSYNEYLAGLARIYCDWLIGMNTTMGLTATNNKMLVKGDVLSAGRVQSPIVNLVYMREQEIKNFIPIEFFKFEADFETETKEKYKGSLNIREEFIDEKTGYLIDENKMKLLLEELKTSKEAKIVKYEKTQKTEKCPIGYSLSELQKDASKRFGMTALETLDTAQSLYETHKLTTYPRSDSGYMDENQHNESKDILDKVIKNFNNTEYNNFQSKINPSKKSSMWDRTKVTAHHAIIPTDINYDLNRLSKKEKDIYDLVCRRYIMQFMPEYKFLSVKVETKLVNDIFTTSGNTTIDMGWKDADEKSKEKNKSIPELNVNQIVSVTKLDTIKDKTKPPSYYTDDTLLEDMVNIRKFVENEKLKKIIKETGIGTEATRANHIQNVFDRGYLKKEEKKIRITDKGNALIEVLPELLKKAETTAYWEEEMNKITESELSLDSFLSKNIKALSLIIDTIKSGQCQLKKPVASAKTKGKIYTCDKCESILNRVKSKKTGKYLHVCQGCGTMYQDEAGRKGLIIERVIQPEGENNCPTCNKNMLLRKNKTNNEMFWVCSDEVCKTFCKDDNGKIGEKVVRKEKATSEHKCPKCKEGFLVPRQGSKGKFWGCNNYPKCSAAYPDENDAPNTKPASDHKCPNCKDGYLVQKNSTNGKFWACNSFPKCKTSFPDEFDQPNLTAVKKEAKEKQTSEHKCPNCKTGHLIQKTGPKGKFWSCNQYPKCNTAFQDKEGKPNIITGKK